MRYVKWTFITALVLSVFGLFHYTLPQHDIVRIVNTYEERQDLSGWTTMFWQGTTNGTDTQQTRDVQFIQAVFPDGDTMVYRNEDTGWGWPFYFKFDTANLYTEANDAISTKAAPEWYSVTHYGWRNEILSIFPNAVAIKPVEGPDASIFPWFNVVFLTLLVIFILLIRRMWLQFRERSIDPLLEDVDEAWDDRTSGIRSWFKRRR
ncbi:DUF1523 family protein [Celeribacter sp.]|uniref:DUF1523 family protein n=1 Tax=Celeribacter sp. TaxID=1890673 RepID=UPI003A94145E